MKRKQKDVCVCGGGQKVMTQTRHGPVCQLITAHPPLLCLLLAILEMQRGGKGTGLVTPVKERERVSFNGELCDG